MSVVAVMLDIGEAIEARAVGGRARKSPPSWASPWRSSSGAWPPPPTAAQKPSCRRGPTDLEINGYGKVRPAGSETPVCEPPRSSGSASRGVDGPDHTLVLRENLVRPEVPHDFDLG